MGADVIGWRNCRLQHELEPAGFLSKLKLKMYRGAIEAQVPPDERETIRVTVQGSNRAPKELTYRGIVDEIATFEQGIPDCASCVVGGGQALGCYRYVTYPVDEVFEKTVFDFFVDQLGKTDSIGDQLYQAVVSQQPSRGTSFHEQRGPAETGGIAMLSQPLVHTWGGMFSKRRVDSAQMLASIFITLEQPAVVVAYARFFAELVKFGQARGAGAQSKTFREVQDLVALYLATVPYALEGKGFVLVDG